MARLMTKLWLMFIVRLPASAGLQAQTVTDAVLGRVTDPLLWSDCPVGCRTLSACIRLTSCHVGC